MDTRSNYLIIAVHRRALTRLTRTIETDVCVVGAGLIGLAHAHAANRRGLSVVVLERDPRANGASLRQSGHLFFSALASGPALDAVPQARERWLELTARAGVPANEGGTLIVARRPEELAVMEAAAAEPARFARMRSSKKIAKLTALPVEGVLGGFHAKQDLRVDPRSTSSALASALTKDPSARIEWGAQVHEVEPGMVHAGALRVRAGAIVICPGADQRMLPQELRSQTSGLTLCRTQMLRLASPGGRRYRQTFATGLSLLEYPGFSAQEGAQALRERLELETPELVERGVSLVVAQLRDGDLIVGGTATYADFPKPFSRERLDELMLAQTAALLDSTPVVKQRWSSTQTSLPSGIDDFVVTRPMPGVRVVQAVSGTAAALCHWHAEKVLAELLVGIAPVDMYITVHDMREAAAGGGGLRAHARVFGNRR